MTVLIEIVGSTLRLPDGSEIADCWDKQTPNMLSKSAGLALFPYLNEATRLYEMQIETPLREGVPDEAIPDWNPPYAYRIDGEDAIPGNEVIDCGSPIITGCEPRTGRIVMTKVSELL
jgi:hypothetical protein